ncbi:MAG: hypothetical protein WDN00_03845 [Limisphaerales bacterium]
MEAFPKIIFVVAVLVGVTLFIHAAIPHVIRASLVVAGLCGIIFTIMCLVQEHTFSLVPFFIGGLYGFIFALFIGFFFYLGRKFTPRD